MGLSHRGALVIAIVGAAAGCPEVGPLSVGGHYTWLGHGLSVEAGGVPRAWSGQPVLVGDSLCPTLFCSDDACQAEDGVARPVDACVTVTPAGALAAGADGCFVVVAPGRAEARVVPRDEPCAIEGVGDGVALAPDSFAFDGIDRRDVTPVVFSLLEAYLAGTAFDGQPPLAFESEGAPLPVGLGAARDTFAVAESGAWVAGRLLRSADGAAVAFADGLALIDVAPAGDAVRLDPTLGLVAAPGATATLTLAGVPAAQVVGRAAAEVAALDVTALYSVSADQRSPLALWAQAALADGTALDGAPVAWSIVEGTGVRVRGMFQALDQDGAESPATASWAVIDSDVGPCGQPDQARRAVVRAALGALTRDIELAWTVPGTPCPPPVVAGAAPGGCGCGAVDGAPLAMVATLALSRRRRSPWPTKSSRRTSPIGSPPSAG